MNQQFKAAIERKDKVSLANVIQAAQACVPEEYYDRPWRYFQADDRNGRSYTITDDTGIFCYLSAYGTNHERKLQIALEGLIHGGFSSGGVNIVDWGCGQGLGTLKFLDYMERKGITLQVENIVLIEPSARSLEYAELFLTERFRGDDSVHVKTVCKLFGDVTEADLSFESTSRVVHIFSNVLDLGGINMKELAGHLRDFRSVENYVVATSPYYTPGRERFDTFFSYLNHPTMLFREFESNKDANRLGSFTYNIRVDKLLAEAIRRIRDLRFYTPRQFFAASRLDMFGDLPVENYEKYAVFDVYAPYELATSFHDDIDPLFAILSNIITRGVPTKASPFVEQQLSEVYSNSQEKSLYGGVSFKSLYSKKEISSLASVLETGDFSGEKTPLVMTPIAVSRIEKTVIEALISGKISLEKERWSVVVEEKDVPCAALAFRELASMFDNLAAMTENYSHLRFPEVDLSVVNAGYPDSPLHLGAQVYSRAEDLQDREFDLAIDYSSSRKGDGEYPFTKYNVANECYYAIFSADERVAQRSVYTTDLVTYRTFSNTDETGLYSENIVLSGHLEYFLQLIFRKESFRPGQLPILTRALQNKSVIGLLPTGGGKSLTYQLAAMLQPGITIVIDPLRSLMLDQYEGLIANGIDTCTFINSDLGKEERVQREYKVEQAQCQFVFMSPERLCIYSFRKRLKNMHEANVYFAYGVIDEVHCVSEWGQDFRFSYLHLGRNLYQYVRAKQGEVTLFGLTATASFDVLADVERELSGNGAYKLEEDAIIRWEDTNRLELQYRVLSVPISYPTDKYFDPNGYFPTGLPRPVSITPSRNVLRPKNEILEDLIEEIPDMVAELTEEESVERIVERYYERQHKDREIGAGDELATEFNSGFIEEQDEYDQAGIIFCPHKSNTEISVDTCADKLRYSISDIGTFYSSDNANNLNRAQNDIDSDAIRCMKLFRDNKLPIMVATKAFGMGIDKPNVRFTINMNYSDSLEAFVQEAGRAGRDRAMALSFILVSDYRLIRVNRDCPINEFPMGLIKGRWFKEEDLDTILDYYGITIDKENWCSYCNPNVDVVKLKCDENPVAFGNFCNGCEYKGNCGLERVKNRFKGWSTYQELQDAAASCGVRLVGRNIEYQSPDYAVRMYFYDNAYPGRNAEKKTMVEFMSRLTVSSFIGDTQERANTGMTTQRGFLDLVLSKEPGTEVVSIISYAGLDTAAFSKAIYRMCCIGLIDDFTINYSDRTYRIVCRRKPDGGYYACLKDFLMRYYPENRAQREIDLAKTMRGENEVHKCLGYLTEFIYENLAIKKKRAIDDIRTFCNMGLDRSKDWKEVNEDLKDYIYYYFNSKYAKEDYCLDTGEPYSLTRDTDFGKDSSNLELVHKYIKVVEEEICGSSGNPIDNIKHLQGAVRLISRAITGVNPVIDLLNVFCILFLKEYRTNESIRQTLENCYVNAYTALWDEMEDKEEFYSFFSDFKEDIYKHGADRDFDETLEMIEVNCEVNRHREFLGSFAWTKNKNKN